MPKESELIRDPHLAAKEKFPKDQFPDPYKRRMAIILETPLFLPEKFVAKKESIQDAEAHIARRKSSIVDGVHVKRENAQFAFVHKTLPTGEDLDKPMPSDVDPSVPSDSGTTPSQHTVFLLKEKQRVENIFEHYALRLLSKSSVSGASYTVKRVTLFDGNPNIMGVKWDENLEILLRSRKMREHINPKTNQPYRDEDGVVIFLKQYDLQNDNEETKKITELGSARLWGVLAVLGSHDWNPKNYYFNSVTGKVVIVDVGSIVDRHSSTYYASDTERFPIFGSPQSNDFLRIFLGKEDIGSAVHRGVDKYGEIKKKITIYTAPRYDTRIISEGMCEAYNEGIDDELFRKIEKNLNADQSLVEPFIEFMRGLNDAIELSKDETFLNAFKEKVSREAGGTDAEIVANQIKILKENGEKAEKQYRKLIVLHSRIIAKLSRDQRKRKISDEHRSVSDDKPPESVKPDQTYELRTGRDVSDQFHRPESGAISVHA